MTALLAALAALAIPAPIGPPAPVLHSHGRALTAARGSFCWPQPAQADASAFVCADSLAPVTRRSLRVSRHGRVRIEMRIATDTLSVSLRGRAQKLRVTRKSSRRFLVRLPRRMKRRPVLDLFATYPQGDGSFGARLRVR